jgi:hypothetical protein
MSIVEMSEFKGNKMIVMKKDAESRYPFQFGLNKAKMIVENIAAIQKFVADNDVPAVVPKTE